MPPGLWGLNRRNDKSIGNNIFEKLTDPNMISWFDKNRNNQEFVQLYMKKFIHNYAYDQSLGHDSFFCKNFPINTRAFPVRRSEEYCYLSNNMYGCCINETSNNYYSLKSNEMKKCPELCRPTDKKDWIFC